jgi:sialic acid synthase SpsE
MSNEVNILGYKVGDNNPCFIIGDIGLNHNGSIDIAKKLISVATEAGCNAVKFQKRDIESLAIKEVLDAPDNRFPEFGSTYRAIREHLEFNEAQYLRLMDYAKQQNISFFCTPFDIKSVIFLQEIGVKAFKIASHNLTNFPLIEYVAKLKMPTILSTGMATLADVDRSVNIFKKYNCPLILLHCVSVYPQPTEESNLKLIDFYKKRYNIPVGYSGHEIGYLPTLGAVFRGANAVERHITLDTNMVGLDHKLSLSPEQLKAMVKDIRIAEKSLGSGKKFISEKEMITLKKYHVSAVSKIEIKPGTKIDASMITFKNPGIGIPPYEVDKVIGKIAKVYIPKDILIKEDMFK